MKKAKLRGEIISKRQLMSEKEWQEKSQKICDRLKEFSVFNQATTVLSYFSFRREPDLSSLFTIDKKWGFSRCIDGDLVWHLWRPNDTLKLGKYGIKEPLCSAPLITSLEVDLMIVPTVACDRDGYRLGYGGGYYDRLLSSLQWHNIPTIGVVFDYAYIEQLPRESWDVRLKYICTELSLDECQ